MFFITTNSFVHNHNFSNYYLFIYFYFLYFEVGLKIMFLTIFLVYYILISILRCKGIRVDYNIMGIISPHKGHFGTPELMSILFITVENLDLSINRVPQFGQ